MSAWGEEPPEPGGKFIRVDLAEVLDNLPPRPRKINPLVYESKIHTIGGPPESGKSTIAWAWMLRAVANGEPVVAIDSEAGQEHTADLLRSFGADMGEIKRLVHYFPDPDVCWHDGDLSELHELMTEVEPRYVMFDSAVSLLEQAGLSENASTDVRRLYRRLLFPLARSFGASVLVTDHDSKDGMASRYNRGSTDKLGVTDVSLKVCAEEPFTRDMDGLLTVHVTKDRAGCLHRWWQVRVTRNPLALQWVQTAKPVEDSGSARSSGPSPRVADALERVLTTEPQTVKAMVDQLVQSGAYPHGIKADTARKALALLLEEDRADRIEEEAEGSRWPVSLWHLPIPRESRESVTDPAGDPAGDPAASQLHLVDDSE